MNAPADKNRAGSPEDWIAHAESDLHYAKVGFKQSAILAAQICFHAQQSVEKAIKALLISRNIDFPWIHDLQALFTICEESGIPVEKAVQEADALTPYATEARYPGYWEEIRPADTEEAIHLAERVLAWTKKEIQNRPRASSSKP